MSNACKKIEQKENPKYVSGNRPIQSFKYSKQGPFESATFIINLLY